MGEKTGDEYRLASSRFNRAREGSGSFVSDPLRVYCPGWAEIGTLSTRRKSFQGFEWQSGDNGYAVPHAGLTPWQPDDNGYAGSQGDGDLPDMTCHPLKNIIGSVYESKLSPIA